MIYSCTRSLALVVCSVSFATTQAQDNFGDVPDIYTRSPQVFRHIFQSAQTSTVRALMIGDSQERSPGGQGNIYVPRWNAEMFSIYGNAPETPLAPMHSSSGGGLPWGDWLSATAHTTDGPAESYLPTSFLPPGFVACRASLSNGSNVNHNQWLGQLVGLKHHAEMCNPDSMLPNTAEYFHRGLSVFADVIAVSNVSSGEVRIDAKPNTSATQNFYLPITSTHVSSMDLEGAPGQVRHQRLGPFLFAGRDYMQIDIAGTDPTKFTEILAARIVSSVDQSGWVVQSIAAGGYTSASILQNHADCGPVLAAIEPSIAILAFGANDSGLGVSTTEYRANLESLIAFLRQHLGSRFPIILIADPWRSLPVQSQRDTLDRFPGVCYDIARADPFVCALNSRKLLDAVGWNQSGQATFLADDVHYSPLGAITKARVEVQRLQLAFGSTSCPADLDDGTATGTPDGGITIDDLLFYLTAFELGTTAADFDDGSGTGAPDGGVTIDDLLFYLQHFEAGC